MIRELIAVPSLQQVRVGFPTSLSSNSVQRGSLGGRYSRADLAALLAVVLWGINVSCSKIVLGELDAITFATVRVGISAVLSLAALVLLERNVRVKRADLRRLAVVGIVGVGLPQIVFIFGLSYTYATHGALLIGMNPVFAALMAAWWGLERLRWVNWLGIALSFGGIVLLTGTGFGGTAEQTLFGDGVTLFSVLLGASFAVMSKRFLGDYSPLKVVTYSLIFSTLVLLALGLTHLLAQNWSAVSLYGLGALAFGIVLGTVIANVLWLKSVSRIGIVRTSLYQYVLPVVGVALAWLFLKEELSLRQMMGAVLVVGGALLARL